MRILLTAATLLRHTITTRDFSVAIMCTPVKEGHEILVQAPPEYGAEGMVWRLKRSLYGLREAAQRFQEFLRPHCTRSRGHTQRDRTRTLPTVLRQNPVRNHMQTQRAWQTSQQSAGRRQEMSQPPAERHMAMVHRVTRDWKRVRGSTDYRLGLDRMSRDAEVHVLWHHPMARGDHQLAREDGVSTLAVKPRSRVPGGSGTCLRDALRSRACESSASSAIAMATRRGLERPRHLKVKWPGLQQLVNAGRIRIVSVKGMENLPDVGTKFVVKAALDTRRKGLGLTRIGNGVAVILTNPTHMGAATLMMLISGVSAEPQEAQTCCIIWTVLTVWTLLSVTAAIVIDKAFTRPTMLKHQRLRDKLLKTLVHTNHEASMLNTSERCDGLRKATRELAMRRIYSICSRRAIEMKDSNCPVTTSDARRQSVTIGFSADLSHPLRVRCAGFE